MTDDKLDQLLKRGDGPPDSADHQQLAARVRIRRSHKARQRAIAISTTVLALVVGSLVMTRSSPRQSQPPQIAQPGEDQQQLQREHEQQLAALIEEERVHSAVTSKMLAAIDRRRRLARSREILALPDVQQIIAAEQEKAADLLIRMADEAQRHSPDGDRQYRQVVELFPVTASAQVAREKLGPT